MKLDSSDTDNSSKNTYSSSEENFNNVTFYRWQIVEKKITKSKVDVTLKDAAEVFTDDIKRLKEHIYIKRRQVNAYHIDYMLYKRLKSLVFHKRFHNNSELWLKFLLFHKSFPKNTKFF